MNACRAAKADDEVVAIAARIAKTAASTAPGIGMRMVVLPVRNTGCDSENYNLPPLALCDEAM
jgi:hypothetical protein